MTNIDTITTLTFTKMLKLLIDMRDGATEIIELECGETAKRLPTLDGHTYEKTAVMFRALGDPSRLKLLSLMQEGPLCVGQLVELTGESTSMISQRLKILYQAELLCRERNGKHVYYSVTDDHVIELLTNGFDHATGKGHR